MGGEMEMKKRTQQRKSMLLGESLLAVKSKEESSYELVGVVLTAKNSTCSQWSRYREPSCHNDHEKNVKFNAP